MDNNKKDLNHNKKVAGNSKNNGQKPINPLLAGALGVAAGAAAYALTKKDNQEKIKNAAANMKDELGQKARNVKGGLAQKADQIGDKLKDVANKTKRQIDKAQENIEKNSPSSEEPNI